MGIRWIPDSQGLLPVWELSEIEPGTFGTVLPLSMGDDESAG